MGKLKYLDEFADETSLHGPSEFKSSSRPFKPIWLVIVCACAVMAFYQIYLVINSFLDSPTITTYETKSATNLTFPFTQVCLSNPIDERKVTKAGIHPSLISTILVYRLDPLVNIYYKDLEMGMALGSAPHDAEVFEAKTKDDVFAHYKRLYDEGKMGQSLVQPHATADDKYQALLTEFRAHFGTNDEDPFATNNALMSAYLTSNGKMDYDKIWKSFTFDVQSVFKTCLYGGREYDCSKIATPTFDVVYGICYGLQAPGEGIQTQNGVGLSVVVNTQAPHAQKWMPVLQDGLAIRVDDVYDPTSRRAYSVPLGTSALISLYLTKFDLSISEKTEKCRNDMNREITQITYSDTSCRTECISRATMRQCGCVSPIPQALLIDPLTPTCGFVGMTCIVDTMDFANDVELNECYKECLPRCQYSDFRTVLSYRNFPSKLAQAALTKAWKKLPMIAPGTFNMKYLTEELIAELTTIAFQYAIISKVTAVRQLKALLDALPIESRFGDENSCSLIAPSYLANYPSLCDGSNGRKKRQITEIPATLMELAVSSPFVLLSFGIIQEDIDHIKNGNVDGISEASLQIMYKQFPDMAPTTTTTTTYTTTQEPTTTSTTTTTIEPTTTTTTKKPSTTTTTTTKKPSTTTTTTTKKPSTTTTTTTLKQTSTTTNVPTTGTSTPNQQTTTGLQTNSDDSSTSATTKTNEGTNTMESTTLAIFNATSSSISDMTNYSDDSSTITSTEATNQETSESVTFATNPSTATPTVVSPISSELLSSISTTSTDNTLTTSMSPLISTSSYSSSSVSQSDSNTTTSTSTMSMTSTSNKVPTTTQDAETKTSTASQSASTTPTVTSTSTSNLPNDPTTTQQTTTSTLTPTTTFTASLTQTTQKTTSKVETEPEQTTASRVLTLQEINSLRMQGKDVSQYMNDPAVLIQLPKNLGNSMLMGYGLDDSQIALYRAVHQPTTTPLTLTTGVTTEKPTTSTTSARTWIASSLYSTPSGASNSETTTTIIPPTTKAATKPVTEQQSTNNKPAMSQEEFMALFASGQDMTPYLSDPEMLAQLPPGIDEAALRMLGVDDGTIAQFTAAMAALDNGGQEKESEQASENSQTTVAQNENQGTGTTRTPVQAPTQTKTVTVIQAPTVTYGETYAEQHVLLEIAYNELQYFQVTQEVAIKWDGFIAQIGGHLGLFLGASIVTVSHTILFVIEHIYLFTCGQHLDIQPGDDDEEEKEKENDQEKGTNVDDDIASGPSDCFDGDVTAAPAAV